MLCRAVPIRHGLTTEFVSVGISGHRVVGGPENDRTRY